MICKKCGQEFEDNSKFCPFCGAEVTEQGQGEQNEQPEAVAQTEQTQQEVQPEQAVQATEAAQDTETETTVAAEAVNPVKKITENFSVDKIKDIKNFKHFKALIACVCVLVAVIVVCANFSRLSNFAIKQFGSDNSYYKHVEKQALMKSIKDLGAGYSTTADTVGDAYNTTLKYKLSVELGDKGKDLLGVLWSSERLDRETGLDADTAIGWIDDADISIESTSRSDAAGGKISFNINGVDMVSFESIFDPENKELFIKVPEFDSKYLYFDEDDIIGFLGYDGKYVMSALDEVYGYSDRVKVCVDALPSKSKVVSLISKYLEIALGKMEDITIEDGVELEVDGKTVKVSEIEVSITAEVLEEIITAVCEELKDDKDVKKIFINLIDAAEKTELLDVDGEEAYEDFVERLEETIDDAAKIAKEALSGKKVKYYAYVDGKGDIVGRKVKYASESSYTTSNYDYIYDTYRFETVNVKENREIYYTLVTKGKNYAFEAVSSYSWSDDDYSYSSNGKITSNGTKSNGKYTGDVTVATGGNTLAQFKVEKLDLSEILTGKVSGAVIVDDKEILEDYGLTAIKKPSARLDFDLGGSSAKLALTLLSKEDKVAAVSLSVKKEKASKLSIPNSSKATEIEDEDDLADWASGLKISDLKKKLKKAKAPSELTDMLDELEDFF